MFVLKKKKIPESYLKNTFEKEARENQRVFDHRDLNFRFDFKLI